MATAYELSWQFNLNNNYAPATVLDGSQHAMWFLASSLIGGTAAGGLLTTGLWTLYGSSDSVSASNLAGVADPTDRWSLNGAYDASKIVRGSGGAIHSWVVLRSPSLGGSNWYLTLDFNTGSNQTWGVILSKAAPTGGLITARPTATDEWVPNAAYQVWSGTTAGSARHSISLTTRGDFWFTNFGTSPSAIVSLMMVQLPADTHALDAYPLYSWASANPSATSLAPPALPCRNWNGTGVDSAGILIPQAGNAQVDALSGNNITLPAHILRGTTYAMYGGRLQDVKTSLSASPAAATVLRVAGNILWCSYGALWLPSNAALV